MAKNTDLNGAKSAKCRLRDMDIKMHEVTVRELVDGCRDEGEQVSGFRNWIAAVVAAVVLQGAADCITGKVTRVSDGDTVWVTDTAKLRHKVRLDRIDAPEKDQPWGKESSAALKEWVFGKDVRVEYENRDQYGRILGIIYSGTNDVNLAMVRTGNAWHYSHFDKTSEYAAAEKEARAERRGLWSQDNPVSPYKWRRARRKETATSYVPAHGASRRFR